MKIRNWLGFVVVSLVALPGSAMTVGDFAQRVAQQEPNTKVETVLAALPQGTALTAPLTQGAVVQMMGTIGFRLRTSHPDATFPDASVGTLFETRQTAGGSGGLPPYDGHGKKKPRSTSPRQPHPPHGHRGHGSGKP
jgi:hypothetical protein